MSEYSPMDVLINLSKYRRVKVSTKWIDLEIPRIEKPHHHIT
ncbi:MAG: hypothetical protein ACP5QK_01335 [Myxococcota bacterium]